MIQTNKKLIFVSSPYTHEDEAVMEERYNIVTKFCGNAIKQGYNVISPITYGHAIVQQTKLDGDWETWKQLCECILQKCDQMWILKMDGYERSVGVKAEKELAISLSIPISYYNENIVLYNNVKDIDLSIIKKAIKDVFNFSIKKEEELIEIKGIIDLYDIEKTGYNIARYIYDNKTFENHILFYDTGKNLGNNFIEKLYK